MKRAYLVETSKGDALFLDESRAMEYAAKNHGIFIRMYGVIGNNAVRFTNCKENETDEGQAHNHGHNI